MAAPGRVHYEKFHCSSLREITSSFMMHTIRPVLSLLEARITSTYAFFGGGGGGGGVALAC